MRSGSRPISVRSFGRRPRCWRSRLQREVEKPDDRHHRTEGGQQLAIERRAGCELRFELAAGEELLELQVVRGRMIGGIAPGHARQPLPLERSNRLPERRSGGQAMQSRVRFGNVRADGVELRVRRHVETPAHPHPPWRDFEVQPAALAFREAAHREVGGDVRLER